jgi:hypothetical protein
VSLSRVSRRDASVLLEKNCQLQLGELLTYFDRIMSTLELTIGSARWQLDISVPKLRAPPAAKLCNRPKLCEDIVSKGNT